MNYYQIVQTVFGTAIALALPIILLRWIWRAVMALEGSARAHEKSAKAQQDTVSLLRELVVLKSKEEKQS